MILLNEAFSTDKQVQYSRLSQIQIDEGLPGPSKTHIPKDIYAILKGKNANSLRRDFSYIQIFPICGLLLHTLVRIWESTVDTIYTNFQNVFDKVPHDVLI